MATLVVHLLVRGYAPAGESWLIQELHFQSERFGFATDDILALCMDPLEQEHKQLWSVKHKVAFSETDKVSQAVIKEMWTDFKSANFNPTYDRFVLATGPLSDKAQNIHKLLSQVRASLDPADFKHRLDSPGFLSKEARNYWDILHRHCQRAADQPVSVDEFWAFLRCLRVICYDYGQAGRDEAIMETLLDNAAVNKSGHEVWLEVNKWVSESSPLGGVISIQSPDSIPAALRKSVKGLSSSATEMSGVSKAEFAKVVQRLEQVELGVGSRSEPKFQGPSRPCYYGEYSPGSTAIGVLEREIESLRENLMAKESSEIQDLKRRFAEGHYEEVLQALKDKRSSANWPALPLNHKAQVLRLLSFLLLDTDLTESLAVFRELLSLVPGVPENKRLDALLRLRQGDSSGALGLLADSSEINDLHLQVEIHLALGNTTQALQLLETLPNPLQETHRLRALAYLHSGRQGEARAEIDLACELKPIPYGVRVARGKVLFYSAVSPTAIPPHLVNTPPAFPLSMRVENEKSRANLLEAKRCFESLLHLGSEVRVKDIHCWIMATLICLDSDEAKGRLQEFLKREPGNLVVIGWALVSKMQVDLGPSQLSLRERLDRGDQDLEVILVLGDILLQSRQIDDFEGLLSDYQSVFAHRQAEPLWLAWRCEGLIAADRVGEALALLPSDPQDATLTICRANLLALAASKGLVDNETAVSYLMTKHLEIGDPLFLLMACKVQYFKENWDWVKQRAEELIARVGTAEAVTLAVKAARNGDDPDLCLKLLQTNQAPASPPLQESQVWALSRLGRYDEALHLAEELWEIQPNNLHFKLLADLRVTLGDEPGLASLARKVKDLNSAEWLWLSKKLSKSYPEQAKEYWRKSVALGLEDNQVFPAFILATQLDLDSDPGTEEVATRLQTLASGSHHGVQRLELNQLKEFVLARGGRAQQAEWNYRRGASVHELAQFGLRLPTLYHELLVSNEGNPRPDMQPPLMFRSGVRNFREVIPANARLHIDVTSLLLAHHFELLDVVCEVFRPLRIPPSLLPALQEFRDDFSPSQPALIEAVKSACRVMDENLISVEDVSDPQTAWRLTFESEGDEKPGRTSAHSVLQVLLEEKKISSHNFEQATRILGTTLGVNSSPRPGLGQTIRIPWEWARLLAQADVIKAVAGNFCLVISREDAQMLRDQRGSAERESQTRAWLANLIEKVTYGLDSGTFERIQVSMEQLPCPRGAASLRELLRCNLKPGDSVWIDDRFVTMWHEREGGIPIVGMLDVWSSLHERGQITDEEYYRRLERFRRANLRFIPLDHEELHFWLLRDPPCQAELDIVRKNVAACFKQSESLVRPQPGEALREWSFLTNSSKAMLRSIVRCFEGDDHPRAVGRADLLMKDFYVEPATLTSLAVGPRETVDNHLVAMSLAAFYCDGFVCFPGFDAKNLTSRRRLFRWLDTRLMRTQLPKPGFLKALADEMNRNLLAFMQRATTPPEVAKAVLQRWVLELDPDLQEEILKDSTVADAVQIRGVQQVAFGQFQFEDKVLFAAVEHSFREGSCRFETLDRQPARIDLLSQQPLKFCVSVGGSHINLSDPTLALLSNDLALAEVVLGNHLEWFDGPKSFRQTAIADILKIAAPQERLQKVKEWQSTSPAVRYGQLIEDVARSRQSNLSLFTPTSTERLLNRYGLSGMKLADPTALDLNVTYEQFEVDGFESALIHCWAFPVSLPAALVDRYLSLEPQVRLKTARNLIVHARSPIALTHLVRLWVIAPEPQLHRLARLTLHRYLSPELPWLEAFLTIAQWCLREIGIREADPVIALCLTWAHAHELFQSLVSARAHHEDIQKTFSQLVQGGHLLEKLQEMPLWFDDVANPDCQTVLGFLSLAVLYVLGKPATKIEGVLDRLAGLLQGRGVLLENALGPNVLNTWLGPVPLTELPESNSELIELSREYPSLVLERVTKMIQEDPSNWRGWDLLREVTGYCRPPDDTLAVLESGAAAIRLERVIADNTAGDFVDVFLIVCRGLRHTSVGTRRGFFQKFLGIYTDLRKGVPENALLSFLFYEVSLELSVSDTQAASIDLFCEFLEQSADIVDPSLVDFWRGSITQLCVILPADLAPRAWRCLVHLRCK